MNKDGAAFGFDETGCRALGISAEGAARLASARGAVSTVSLPSSSRRAGGGLEGPSSVMLRFLIGLGRVVSEEDSTRVEFPWAKAVVVFSDIRGFAASSLLAFSFSCLGVRSGMFSGGRGTVLAVTIAFGLTVDITAGARTGAVNVDGET